MSEKEFPKGLFAKRPHANAPQFVKAKLSIKREDLINYLQGKRDEWLNFDVTENREGDKYSISLDTWKPNGSVAPRKQDDDIKFPEEEINPQDIPF